MKPVRATTLEPVLQSLGATARSPQATARSPRATARSLGATARSPRATARSPGATARSPRATATDIFTLEGPCSATREAPTVRSWCITTEEQPLFSATIEKIPHSNEDPAQPEINK